MCFLCIVRHTTPGTVYVTVVSDKKRDRKARKNGKKKEIVFVKVNKSVSYIVVVVQKIHVSVFKLIDIRVYNYLYVSAKYVAIFREVKYKARVR
jgi:hypothetical protein